MLLLHACTARSVDTGADLRLAQWAHNEAPALESGQVPDELAQVWLGPSQWQLSCQQMQRCCAADETAAS